MMRAVLKPKVGLGIVTAVAGMIGAGVAGAAQYACQVPLAVLCQGCAADVIITLQPRGGCRVTFTPAPGAAPPPVSGAVTLQIQIPALPVRRGIYSRARRAVAPVSSSRGACFAFNGHQYCE